MISRYQSFALKIFGFFLVSGLAFATGQSDPAEFVAALTACEASSYNTAHVSLPTPEPGARPRLSGQQMALVRACQQAGLLPPPPSNEPKPPTP
jgi:hypothetical protein